MNNAGSSSGFQHAQSKVPFQTPKRRQSVLSVGNQPSDGRPGNELIEISCHTIVYKIDDVQEEAHLRVTLCFQFKSHDPSIYVKDEKLKALRAKTRIQTPKYKPVFLFQNCIRKTVLEESYDFDHASSEIIGNTTYMLVLRTDFDLAYYPYDVQYIAIWIVVLYGRFESHGTVRTTQSITKVEKQNTVAFFIKNWALYDGIKPTLTFPGDTEAKYQLYIERKVKSYHINVQSLVFAIVSLSFFVFALDCETSLANRLNINVTLFLTLVAFKLSIQRFVPSSNTMMLHDRFLIAAFTTLIVVTTENFVITIVRWDKPVMVIVDAAFGCFLFLIWIFINLIYYLSSKRFQEQSLVHYNKIFGRAKPHSFTLNATAQQDIHEAEDDGMQRLTLINPMLDVGMGVGAGMGAGDMYLNAMEMQPVIESPSSSRTGSADMNEYDY